MSEHILTTFGREYPLNSSDVGFPVAYYTSTFQLIRTWYSRYEVLIGDGTNNGHSIVGKPYKRSKDYQNWNSEKLAAIGLTEFLQNLAQHLIKLLKAIEPNTSHADKKDKLKLVEATIIQMNGVMYQTFSAAPTVRTGGTDGSSGSSGNRSIGSSLELMLLGFGTTATEACKVYNVLTCQISDAILVNALAAIVTMQRVHIKINEKLYTQPSTSCPLSVPWEGTFGPHGVQLWDRTGVDPQLRDGAEELTNVTPDVSSMLQNLPTSPPGPPPTLNIPFSQQSSYTERFPNENDDEENDEERGSRNKVQRLF